MHTKRNWNLFSQYYNKFIGPIYRYILLRTGIREEAEDITAEIFTKALEHFEHYDVTRPFSNWIFTIARNHLNSYLKSRKTTISLEDIDTLKMPLDLEAEYEQKEKYEKITTAMKHLHPDKRDLIEMKYLLGYSYKEIGEIVGKDENTVKVATFRSIEELKQRLSLSS